MKLSGVTSIQRHMTVARAAFSLHRDETGATAMNPLGELH